MENKWIEINKDKSNLPTENGDYFVFVGLGGNKGIQIINIDLKESYGISFIETHGTHYQKVQFPERP